MVDKKAKDLILTGLMVFAVVGIIVFVCMTPTLATIAWAYDHQDEIKQAQENYEKEQAAAEAADIPAGYIKVHSSGVQLINTDSIVKVTPYIVNGVVRAQITVEEQHSRWSYYYGNSRNISYITEESYNDVVSMIAVASNEVNK